jgi:hypothetical protein
VGLRNSDSGLDRAMTSHAAPRFFESTLSHVSLLTNEHCHRAVVSRTSENRGRRLGRLRSRSAAAASRMGWEKRGDKYGGPHIYPDGPPNP